MQDNNYWFMEASKAISLISNQMEYDLPSDFKEEIAVFTRDAETGTYNQLKKFTSDDYTNYIEKYEMPNLYGDYILNPTALSTGSTPEEIASTVFEYRINGATYSAAAVETAFTAADTINTGTAAGSFWGIWLVQINALEVISTKSPSADQVYTTEALAIAALPAVDTDNVSMGYVVVQSNSGAAWTAQTDDLTAGSDCLDVNYYNTASAVTDEQNTEWPLYYYIKPTATVGQLKIQLLPIPEDDKYEGFYVRYYKYLPALSDTVDTWNAYNDDISNSCPEFLIWMGVSDIAMVQQNPQLAGMAERRVSQFRDEFKAINFKLWDANVGRIPYNNV
jgi:hypothetical protein